MYNLVRGLAPYPAAFTELQGKKIKIFKAEKINSAPVIKPGNVDTDQKTYLHFACSNGYISILELQPEGKKRMPVADFLRGFRFG